MTTEPLLSVQATSHPLPRLRTTGAPVIPVLSLRTLQRWRWRNSELVRLQISFHPIVNTGLVPTTARKINNLASSRLAMQAIASTGMVLCGALRLTLTLIKSEPCTAWSLTNPSPSTSLSCATTTVASTTPSRSGTKPTSEAVLWGMKALSILIRTVTNLTVQFTKEHYEKFDASEYFKESKL